MRYRGAIFVIGDDPLGVPCHLLHGSPRICVNEAIAPARDAHNVHVHVYVYAHEGPNVIGADT